jgi:hypothetical protein
MMLQCLNQTASGKSFMVFHGVEKLLILKIILWARFNLYLTLKRIYMDAKGDYMWNLNKDKGPREIVEINEKTKLVKLLTGQSGM